MLENDKNILNEELKSLRQERDKLIKDIKKECLSIEREKKKIKSMRRREREVIKGIEIIRRELEND